VSEKTVCPKKNLIQCTVHSIQARLSLQCVLELELEPHRIIVTDDAEILCAGADAFLRSQPLLSIISYRTGDGIPVRPLAQEILK
jgi:hypothetical protein